MYCSMKKIGDYFLSLLAGVLLLNSAIVAQTSLQIIQPNGGEELTAGQTYKIKWTASHSTDPIRLEYSVDGGGGMAIDS